MSAAVRSNRMAVPVRTAWPLRLIGALGFCVALSGCNNAPDSTTTASVTRAAARHSVATGAATDARFVRLEATSEVNGNPWTSVAELDVLDTSGAAIARAGWNVAVDSQELVGEDAAAAHAIDGDAFSFWHTQWMGASPPHPHAITVDLGASHVVGGFRYLPRQVGENGRIANWNFYVSADGNGWTLLASGTFPNSADAATVRFTGSAAPNRPPVLTTPANRTDAVGGPVSQAVVAVDPDGDALSFTASGLPPGLAIDAASGTISGTPTTTGAFTVTVQVGDGRGGVASTTFAWAMTAAAGTAITARYVALEALSEVNGNPWTSVAEFNVLDGGGVALARAGWTVTADSQELVGENAAVGHAIDGDAGTFWHTQWQGATPPLPHRLTVDLGRPQVIGGFRYLPRQVGENGRIASWRFYTSTDGQNWTVASDGTFANGTDASTITLNSTPATPSRPIAANQPPVIMTPAPRSDGVGQQVVEYIAASDPDGDALTFTASGMPAGVAIDATTGTMSGTLTAPGTYSVTVQVADGRGGTAAASFSWTVAAGTPGATTAARTARIAAFASGPLVAAAPWRAGETVPLDTVRRLSSGMHIVYTTAGTTGSNEPVVGGNTADGRPMPDGSAIAYANGRVLAQTQAGAPLVATAPNASAAGLIETDFAAGNFQPERIAVTEGCKSLSVGTSYIGHYCYANGVAAGSGNATAVAAGEFGAGLPNIYSYHANVWEEEFVVTDRLFGLVFANSASPVDVEIDGVQVQAGPTISTGAEGWTLTLDYQGVVKRRTVRVVSAAGSTAPSLRGVALTPQGSVAAGIVSSDQVLVLGDSINATVVPTSEAGAQMMSYWICRNLGFGAAINMAVGGSGYISANPNTFNLQDLLANPANRSLIAGYAPNITHVIIGAGFNDRFRSVADVQAAALATWRTVRQLLPNAKITVTDGWSGSSGPDANMLALAAGLSSTFAAWGDPNARLVHSIGTSASTAYVSGTGNAGVPIVAGNSSFYTSTDAVHPSPAGARFLARRLSDDITSAWAGAY